MSTPGQTLRAAREARKLSLKQVMQVTRIRIHYLEAMEADDFSNLPSAAQARGFLRSYAAFLGLNPAGLLPAPPSAAQQSLTANAADDAAPPPEPAALDAADALQPVPTASAAALPTEIDASQPESPPAASQPEAISVPSAPSALALQDLGRSLRLRRELLSLSLEEIERHTRVRKANLQALEDGDLDALPSPVQGRGMLHAYAAFLDMDLDQVMLRFADALQTRRQERQPVAAPRRKKNSWRWPRLFSPDLVFASVMILTVLGLVIWGAARLIAANTPAGEAQAPSISDVLIEAAVPTATPEAQSNSAQEELPTPIVSGLEFPTLAETTPTPLPGTVVQVTLLVSERTFLRVLVDGETAFDGRAAPGAALSFEGNESVEVLTGNGGAVQLLLNQLDQGRLGSAGQVIHFIYTLNGVFTPTPLPSLTPSNTPRFQRTPTPSVTPSLAPLVEP